MFKRKGSDPAESVDGLRRQGDVRGLVELYLQQQIPSGAGIKKELRMKDAKGKTAAALAEIGTPEAVAGLVQAIEAHPQQATIPAKALASIADPSALEALIGIAREHQDALVRAAALGAVARLVNTPSERRGDVIALLAASLEDRVASVGILQGFVDLPKDAWDDESFGLLLLALSDPADQARIYASGILHVMAFSGDPRPPGILAGLSTDPNQVVRSKAAMWAEKLAAAEEEALREAEGGVPAFVGRLKEPFLKWAMGVLMREDEVKSGVVFPALCSACLEDSDRVVEHHATLTWTRERRAERRDATTVIETTPTTSAVFPIPMCERCSAYGMRRRINVTGHGVGLRAERWVRFRFPNLAYYQPFANANRLEWPDRVTQVWSLTMKVQQTRAEAKALEEALEAWGFVQERFGGFHPYVSAKHRLLELEERLGTDASKRAAEVSAEIDRIVAELSLTKDQIIDVRRVANEPFRVLDALADTKS